MITTADWWLLHIIWWNQLYINVDKKGYVMNFLFEEIALLMCYYLDPRMNKGHTHHLRFYVMTNTISVWSSIAFPDCMLDSPGSNPSVMVLAEFNKAARDSPQVPVEC